MGRPQKSDYITLKEASDLLHVSVRTVERMMDAKMLRYRTTPRGYRRLYRSSVDEYLKNNVDNGDSSL